MLSAEEIQDYLFVSRIADFFQYLAGDDAASLPSDPAKHFDGLIRR